MAPPTPMECSNTGCEYVTPAGIPTWDLVLRVLELHTQQAHPAPPAQPRTVSSSAKLEKLPRPTFSLLMTEAQWEFTMLKWIAYISQTDVTPQQKLQQLRAACHHDLLQRVYDAGNFSNLDTDVLLLAAMKKLSVQVIHKTIHMMNMWRMQQEADETVRAYVARITGTADLCDMHVLCTKPACGTKIPYRDHVVLQVLLKGMHDQDIRARVLTRTTGGELKELQEVVSYIAAEEAGLTQSATILHDQGGHIGGVRRSSYRQGQRQQRQGTLQRTDKCGYCDGPQHTSSDPADRKKSCKAFNTTCSKCNKLHHFAKVCRARVPAVAGLDDDSTPAAEHAALTGQFFAMLAETPIPTKAQDLTFLVQSVRQTGPATTLPLPHHVHTAHAGWLRRAPTHSPTHRVDISVDKAAYASLKLSLPRYMRQNTWPGHSPHQDAVFDTGAQMVVVPIDLLHKLKVKPDSIFPILSGLNTVTAAPVDLVGGILIRITATNPKTGISCVTRQLAYVSKSVKSVYLSRDACEDLGTISSSFPEIGSVNTIQNAPAHHIDTIQYTIGRISETQILKCTNTGVIGPDDIPCSCPTRTLPQADPPVLPCEPTQANLPTLKQYIMERFKSSAFNCCERQPLPTMTGMPPMRLFVDPNAKPVAINNASPIPIHWKDAVKGGLDRDERLGVIERVPLNDPVTWNSRMVVTPKADGSPRRVIDFQTVNQHAPRQTHNTRSPWTIASSLPANKVKSVLDNWHGYHSVPLHPEDRHLTTFQTPFGRYRYRTTPQGFLSSGDGHGQRMDLIIGDKFPDADRCVDDSILWSEDISTNFYQVIEFIRHCAANGCTFNASKFQFAEREVKYLGFLITDDAVKPTTEFIDNIMSFPTPRTLTDVRSWFGAINQISYAFASAPIMQPFRHLLSSKVPFYWSAELDDAFEASKREIVKQCEAGVKSFDMDLPTALATDWAKIGMGFWLTQKHCKCDGPLLPGCCKTGWQTVFAGSKFCSPAEANYHPIEGEACAAINGLEKCKFFVLGNPNLILCLDHKPLLATFGSQDMASIPNPRLLNFKMKTLAFRFLPIHIPGKDHVTADTFSRRSDHPNHPKPTNLATPAPDTIMNNVLPAYADHLGPPSWVAPPSAISAVLFMDEPTDEDIATADDLEELVAGKVIAHMASINYKHRNLQEYSPYCQQALLSNDSVETLTWPRLEAACVQCPTYKLLHQLVSQGVPDDSAAWDEQLKPYFTHRHSLSTLGQVVLLHDRPVIPAALRQQVLEHLHGGHAGANMMFERASTCLYWPNFRSDINMFQAACSTCRQIAPSNPALPPEDIPHPTYPFEHVVGDFFSFHSRQYLALADRYSGWLSVLQLPSDDSPHVIKAIRNYSTTFGIPVTLSTDGASVFTSKAMKEFCRKWDIYQRVSSAYHPHSNKRAEVAVKSAKRMVQKNLGPHGQLDTDRFGRALLMHRNNPDPTTGLSPAMILFGRQLRDHLPLTPGKFQLRPEWRQTADMRERCLSTRHVLKAEQLSRGTRQLQPLLAGDKVAIQDQAGNTPRRWTKTGTIIEVCPHSSYLVRVDGSNRATRRNRQFLRKIIPFSPTLCHPVQSPIKPIHPAQAPVPPVQHVHPAPVLPVQHVHPVPQPLPEHPPAQPEVPAAPTPTPQPVPFRKKPIRERWFLAKDLQTSSASLKTVQLASVAPTR